MAFQATAYALRCDIKDPLMKLVFVLLVSKCRADGYSEITISNLELGAGAPVCDLIFALIGLRRFGWINPEYEHDDVLKWGFVYCKLPSLGCFGYEHVINMPKERPIHDALLKERLQDRDGYGCVGCFTEWADETDILPEYNVDHIIPRSIGGLDVFENYQLLCKRCNSRKSNKLGHIDFIGDRGNR